MYPQRMGVRRSVIPVMLVWLCSSAAGHAAFSNHRFDSRGLDNQSLPTDPEPAFHEIARHPPGDGENVHDFRLIINCSVPLL